MMICLKEHRKLTTGKILIAPVISYILNITDAQISAVDAYLQLISIIHPVNHRCISDGCTTDVPDQPGDRMPTIPLLYDAPFHRPAG